MHFETNNTMCFVGSHWGSFPSCHMCLKVITDSRDVPVREEDALISVIIRMATFPGSRLVCCPPRHSRLCRPCYDHLKRVKDSLITRQLLDRVRLLVAPWWTAAPPPSNSGPMLRPHSPPLCPGFIDTDVDPNIRRRLIRSLSNECVERVERLIGDYIELNVEFHKRLLAERAANELPPQQSVADAEATAPSSKPASAPKADPLVPATASPATRCRLKRSILDDAPARRTSLPKGRCITFEDDAKHPLPPSDRILPPSAKMASVAPVSALSLGHSPLQRDIRKTLVKPIPSYGGYDKQHPQLQELHGPLPPPTILAHPQQPTVPPLGVRVPPRDFSPQTMLHHAHEPLAEEQYPPAAIHPQLHFNFGATGGPLLAKHGASDLSIPTTMDDRAMASTPSPRSSLRHSPTSAFTVSPQHASASPVGIDNGPSLGCKQNPPHAYPPAAAIHAAFIEDSTTFRQPLTTASPPTEDDTAAAAALLGHLAGTNYPAAADTGTTSAYKPDREGCGIEHHPQRRVSRHPVSP